jgi:hypothetical protein
MDLNQPYMEKQYHAFHLSSMELDSKSFYSNIYKANEINLLLLIT